MVLIDYCNPEETPEKVRERLQDYEASNDRYSYLALVLANNPHMYEVFDDFSTELIHEGDERIK